jgi:hypothetical protein
MRDGAADLELGKLQGGLGVQVTYTHEGVASTLWALPKETATSEIPELHSLEVFDTVMQFVIPRQLSTEAVQFPPAVGGPIPEDKITMAAVDYYVLPQAGVKSDSLGAVFTLTTSAKQVHRAR